MSTCGCRVYTLNFLAIFSFVFPTAEPSDKNNDANTVHVKICFAYLLGSLALLFTHWEKWHLPLRPHHLCTLLEHWDSVTTILIRNREEIIKVSDSFMAWWKLINVIQSVINSFSLTKYCKEFTGALANILCAIHISIIYVERTFDLSTRIIRDLNMYFNVTDCTLSDTTSWQRLSVTQSRHEAFQR